jgi:hypothetical protein
VTGSIRDIEQNVLQSLFQTVSSNNRSYFHILFLVAFIEDTFIGNIIYYELIISV